MSVPNLTMVPSNYTILGATEISQALAYLHNARFFVEHLNDYSKGIIHRDVKTENVLVTELFTAKLADFGESRQIVGDEDMTVVGTNDFCAPEMLRGERYDKKVDVYSFGVVLAEMVMRTKPYHGVPRAGIQAKIIAGLRPAYPKEFDSQWPQISALMHSCWAPDPEKRPDMTIATMLLQEVSHHEDEGPRKLSSKSFIRKTKSGNIDLDESGNIQLDGEAVLYNSTRSFDQRVRSRKRSVGSRLYVHD